MAYECPLARSSYRISCRDHGLVGKALQPQNARQLPAIATEFRPDSQAPMRIEMMRVAQRAE
jgi:hypothetical protein